MVTEALNRHVVRVPDVTGRPLETARIVLEDAGLPHIVTLYRESYEDRDTVLDQRPACGQMVYETTQVTIWIARRGYIEHLPSIYRRSDAVGRNLVRDLCFVFEHMFDSIEQRLVDGWRYYDPHFAPTDFLRWLARWTALTVDLDWPEEQQRALVKRAVDLYRIRGTKRGLALFLKLFTGHEPDIEENAWPFRGFRIEAEGAEDGCRVAFDTVILPPVDLAHCFIVTMPIKFEDVTPEAVLRIHQVLQLEKPAHTHYYLRFAEEARDSELREFFHIGVRSGIGVGAEILVEPEPPIPPESTESGAS